MKKASAVLLTFVLAACASAPATEKPIVGRYAVVFSHGPDRYIVYDEQSLPWFASALRNSLTARGATIDFVADPAAASNYDAVIVVGGSGNGQSSAFDRTERDASGTRVSREHIGKLTYQILRSGETVGSGSVNMTINGFAQDSADRSSQVAAANALAAQIAQKLGKV